jgi:hypothetical protein
MSEIGLQDLIYQVKQELLAPNAKERARDPYPLFFIDKIELEISVNISHSSSGGIKLTVLDFAEIGGSKTIERERGHVVKVSLSPLESREVILEQALRDPKVRQVVQERAAALVKGDIEAAGEPE